MRSIIYDYETLSQDRINGVVVSLAAVEFDSDRFVSNPYEYEELLRDVKAIKFDVQEQVRFYKRTISKDTLEWWKKQGEEARKQLKPDSVRDKSISETMNFFEERFGNLKGFKAVYTRGNTFDPFFLASTLAHFNQNDPFNWWCYKDTRSIIDGMTFGSGVDNRFMPPEPAGLQEKFIAHDPAHDVVLDVMRLQFCARQLA